MLPKKTRMFGLVVRRGRAANESLRFSRVKQRGHTVELLGYQDLSRSVRAFNLRFVALDRFDFEPGQAISVQFTLEGQSYVRSYSIASPPRATNRLEICARYNPGGPGTRLLWGLRPGDRLTVTGPHGEFLLKPLEGRDCILVAAGTGIAPIRSMLYSVLRNERRSHVTLLFGVRDQEDRLYNADFLELERVNPNFSYRTVMSRPQDDWLGLRGYVQHHVEDAVRNRHALEVYISGKKEMVDDVRQMLEELGLDEGSIHYEKT